MLLADIRARIDAALARAGRPRGAVTLIAVSKLQPEERVRAVLDAGHRVFGENRVQEAEARWPPLRADFEGVELHLVGPLQTNKLARALALFDAIHSLDRDSLARKLADAVQARGAARSSSSRSTPAASRRRPGSIPTRSTPSSPPAAAPTTCPLAGLMAIPPLDEDPAPHFARLAEMAARNGLAGLSMGMSDDFETAIAHGATHVRIGSAIFGARAYRAPGPARRPSRAAAGSAPAPRPRRARRPASRGTTPASSTPRPRRRCRAAPRSAAPPAPRRRRCGPLKA